jgi:hypothetical protein
LAGTEEVEQPLIGLEEDVVGHRLSAHPASRQYLQRSFFLLLRESLARLKWLENRDPSAVAIELGHPKTLLEEHQQIIWPLWLLPTRNMVGASERQHLGLVDQQEANHDAVPLAQNMDHAGLW